MATRIDTKHMKTFDAKNANKSFHLMRITNLNPFDSNLIRWVSKDGIGAFGRLLIGTVITFCHHFRMYCPRRLMDVNI